MKKIRIISLFLLSVLFASSCEKEELIMFDINSGGVVFPGGTSTDINEYPNYNSDSLRYEHNFSFLSAEVGATQVTFKVPIRVVGNSLDYDRKVNVFVIESKTTAEKGNYTIGKCLIPANEAYGYIEVTVKYTKELDEKSMYIHIDLVDSDDLFVGDKRYASCRVAYNNILLPPSTAWTKRSYNLLIHGEANPTSASLNSYSSNAHKLILLAMGWESLPEAHRPPLLMLN